jgi:hypothetical protein
MTPRQITKIANHLFQEMNSPSSSRERSATRIKLVLKRGKAYEMSSLERARSHNAVAATKHNPQAHTQAFFNSESHQLAGARP